MFQNVISRFEVNYLSIEKYVASYRLQVAGLVECIQVDMMIQLEFIQLSTELKSIPEITCNLQLAYLQLNK